MRRYGYFLGATAVAISALLAVPAQAAEPDCGDSITGDLLNASCAPSASPSKSPAAEARVEGVNKLTKTADRESYQPGDKITFTIEISASASGTETDNFHVFDRMDDVLDDSVYNDDAAATTGTVVLRQSGEHRELKWDGQIEPGDTQTLTFSVTANAKGNKQIRNFAQYPAHTESLPCAFKRYGKTEAAQLPGDVDFDALAEQCKVTVVPGKEPTPVADSGESSAAPQLPITGQSLGMLIGAAAALLVIGTALLLFARRRRSHPTAE